MTYMEEALFEHKFWLQILGDHARFIHSSLAPKENALINQARKFITLFDTLLAQVKTIQSDEDMSEFSKTSLKEGNELRNFKLKIIREQLIGKIEISLTATFINHMINELEEYLRNLHYFMEKQVPPILNPIHHHLLWLLDAAGHAGAINDDMDSTEKDIKLQSKKFMKEFEDFYLKAVEMAGYLRTNLNTFPALNRFNNQSTLAIKIFQTFLIELEELEMGNEVISSFTPLMADHMYREECYYLIRLAQSANLDLPACDPTKHRSLNPK